MQKHVSCSNHVSTEEREFVTGKVYKAKRVGVLNDVTESEIQVNDLLLSEGVNFNTDKVEFNTINIKKDARINSVTGHHGFIPCIKKDKCVGVDAKGGGVATQIQIGGVCIDSLGHLDIDVNHIAQVEDRGVVDFGSRGGGLSSGANQDHNMFYHNEIVNSVTVSHTNSTNKAKYNHNEEHIVNIEIAGKRISMLLDSGTQVSVIRSDLLPEDYYVSNNIIRQVKLLGAFGDAVSADIMEIEAKIAKADEEGVSNHFYTSLNIAVCDQLNGDIGLLSVSDYHLLNDNTSFIPNVKVVPNVGRLCLDCRNVDVAELIENNLVSDNDLVNVALGGKFDNKSILPIDLKGESYEKFKEDQLNDSSLINCWKVAANEDKEFMINDVDGLLYHKDQFGGVDIFQLVIPEIKRQVIITAAHDSTWSLHFGSIKTIQRIKAYFYWPSIVHDVRRYVSSCEKCQKRARITKRDRVPIKHVLHNMNPFEHVSIDLIGPLEPKSSSGHQYIICLIDSATRWVEALPLKTLTAKEACDALLLMFSRIGLPKVLVSDNATNLVSGLNKELYKRIGVKMRNSTPLHPEGNSLVERWNQSLKKMLHHVVTSDRPRDWHLSLPFLLWAYRELPNETTGLSPFQLVYGRMIRGPLAILRDHWSMNKDIDSTPQNLNTAKYLDKLQQDLANALALADDNCNTAQDRYVNYYNKTAKHKEFEIGEQVLVLLPSSTNKLVSEWIGPATVVGIVSNYGYRIALNTGAIRILHANNLRKFVTRINAVGVIYDEDKDFGSIECCPPVNLNKDEQETIEAIKNVDLSHLDVQKAKQLRELLYKHRFVFNNRPGTCNVEPHEINLVEGFKPKALKPYRIPEVLKNEVDKQIKQLLEDGKIKESSSCFAHPIVCVAKPNGDVRMCTDLRYVNSGTIRDAYPMPLGEDLLLKICPANFITTLDCTAGYWQIPVKASDTYKTTFV